MAGTSSGTVDGYLNFDTRLNTKNFERDVKSLSSRFGNLQSSVSQLGRTVATAFSTAVIVNFGKQAVQTASQLSNAMTSLKSIVEGQGRSYSEANKYIQQYISDGLVPLSNAVTAYKNLANRGYSDEQIQKVMESLKNSATYGRQASLTLGYAVQSATEGLKNENSILVNFISPTERQLFVA